MDEEHVGLKKNSEIYLWSIVKATMMLIVLVGLIVLYETVQANGDITDTEYSTSLSEATGIVRIIVSIFGGLIGILGIYIAFKGLAGKSDVSIGLGKHKKIEFKRVSQGVVITIIGAAILITALYLLPEKKRERVISGKEIIIEKNGERERLITEE